MNEFLIVFDVGGTSIKYGLLLNEQLLMNKSIKTPESLSDFYEVIERAVKDIRSLYNVKGIGFSFPGAVNQSTGCIEGVSAINYIHNFNIKKELEKKLNLPVSIENDANCAALAEMKYGIGKKFDNLLFIVLGTGVGGSIIIDRKIFHGSHLFGGEFGFLRVNNGKGEILSQLGSPVKMARRFNKRNVSDNKVYSGKEVFEKADTGNKVAKNEVNIFLDSVAEALYNLQYIFDPDAIVIGGAVSRAEFLVPELDKRIGNILKEVRVLPFKPRIEKCSFFNEANQIGAGVNFIMNQQNCVL